MNQNGKKEQFKETGLDSTSFEINENLIIPQAESHYGLDNQFEIIKYNDDNNLLIYINNSNDLILKLINKENIINNTFIMKKLFDNNIREIRYFSKKYNNENINYLLVSSEKSEIKIFELKLNSELFENTLKLINHLTEIYINENKVLNNDFNDLSSCVIKFNRDIADSEIITTCWEGNSIKIFNLFLQNKCKKEIISKTSCNIKYCNIINDRYLVFCGCNSQDKYTCANRVDITKLNYDIEKDKNVEFIKYKDKSVENEENVFFNFIIYNDDNNDNEYLIICDEKGFIRIFNFENQLFIDKIYPSYQSGLNKIIKYKEESMKRLNTILFWKNNCLLITEKNTGYIYVINIIFNKNKIISNIEKCFNLFDRKIISLRKYINENEEYFLALGKDNYIKDNEDINEGIKSEEEKILCFKME